MLSDRKQIHLKEFDYKDTNTVYSLTIYTHDKKPYLLRKEIADLIIGEIDYRVTCGQEVMVFAYCIMPDHLHLLVKLKNNYGRSLHNWIAAFKRYTSRETSLMYGTKPLWQANFYEHIVRRDEDLTKIAEYIVNNPVRKNMVDDWNKYPYARIDFSDF